MQIYLSNTTIDEKAERMSYLSIWNIKKVLQILQHLNQSINYPKRSNFYNLYITSGYFLLPPPKKNPRVKEV